MDEKVKFSFDDDFKIRVLEQQKFARSEEFYKECNNFNDKVNSFREKTKALVEILETHATKIDNQKLRAIGLRILAENEATARKKQQRAMQSMINDKKVELERYSAQLLSLENIEAEQKATLEKIYSTAR